MVQENAGTRVARYIEARTREKEPAMELDI
jgi:hypothetical protein